MAQSFTSNISFTLVDKIFGAVSSIVLTPFIIYCLGMELYGVWVLLISISSYFLLAQFGLNAALFKYVAEYRAKNDNASMASLVVTGFILLLGISISIFIVSFPIGILTFRVLLKKQLASASFFMFIVLIVSICVTLIDQLCSSILLGFQKFGSMAIISIISRLVSILVIIIGLLLHYKIQVLVFANIAMAVTMLLLHFFFCSKLLKGIPFSFRLFDLKIAKSFWGFGAKLQVSLVFTWIAQNFDKILIGKFFGSSIVGFYDIGSRLIMFIREIPIVAFVVLLPRMSALHALNKMEQLWKIYLAGTKITFAFVGMGLGLLIPVAPSLIMLWLHATPNPLSVSVFQVIGIGSISALITGVGSTVGQGIGKPHFEAISNSLAIAVNITVSCLLLLFFGIKGVAWGTCFAYLVHLCFFTYLINREGRISNLKFLLENVPVPVFVCVMCISAGLFLNWAFSRFTFSNLYFGSVVIVVTQIIVVLVLALPIYFYYKYIPRELIVSLLKKH